MLCGVFLFWSVPVTVQAGNTGLPGRIVSLGPALTESLYLLQVPEKIVGVTTYCQNPPEAKTKEKVGSVVEFNLEKVLSLKPDLVLATALTDVRGVEKLKRLGVAVKVFDQARNFNQLCEQFLELGKMVGRPAAAGKIVSQARKKVENVRQRVKNLPKTSVFVQVGTRPLFTVTGDSFVNDYIELAGGTNISRDAKTGLFSREEVLNRNPDVIIIITMGIVGKQEEKNWRKYQNLKAAHTGRIHVLDAYKIGSPTPIGFAETLREIADILHPQ